MAYFQWVFGVWQEICQSSLSQWKAKASYIWGWHDFSKGEEQAKESRKLVSHFLSNSTSNSTFNYAIKSCFFFNRLPNPSFLSFSPSTESEWVQRKIHIISQKRSTTFLTFLYFEWWCHFLPPKVAISCLALFFPSAVSRPFNAVELRLQAAVVWNAVLCNLVT